MSDQLARLSEWYERQCNDSWEHAFGISIETIDNPGWILRVALRDTELLGRDFPERKIERSERDWLICRKVGEQFEGVGGPANLAEIIETFLSWADLPRRQ